MISIGMPDRLKNSLSFTLSARAGFPLLVLLCTLFLVPGCKMFYPDNTSSTPWGRPTRWDEEHGWVIQPADTERRPGDYYR